MLVPFFGKLLSGFGPRYSTISKCKTATLLQPWWLGGRAIASKEAGLCTGGSIPACGMVTKRALELHSRAEPSVEAHHRSVNPDAGRNSGGRWIIIIKTSNILTYKYPPGFEKTPRAYVPFVSTGQMNK